DGEFLRFNPFIKKRAERIRIRLDCFACAMPANDVPYSVFSLASGTVKSLAMIMLLPCRVFAEKDAKAVLLACDDGFALASAAWFRLIGFPYSVVGFVGHQSPREKMFLKVQKRSDHCCCD